MNRQYIFTAPSGAGKTTSCRALAEQARASGWDVAGIICPPVFAHNEKTGILVQDLRTNETRRLAVLATQPATTDYQLPLGQWLFSPSALAWGDQILQTALPCDLLIIDELGPLEFIHKKGWQTALEILPKSAYRTAVVVVRSELLPAAIKLLGQAEIVNNPLEQDWDNFLHAAYSPKKQEND